MKEFFFTILFIVIIFGGFFFIAFLPFLIRDLVRRSRRKARQGKFRHFTELQTSKAEVPVFDLSVRLYKDDLIRVVALSHRLHYPWLARVVLTLLFGWWLVAGSSGILKMIIGQDSHELSNWIRCLLGVFVGFGMLWIMWISSLLTKSRVKASSEMEISQMTETDYVISPEGIRVSVHGHEIALHGWDDLDSVVLETDALRIMLKSNHFIWIPKDALFRMGDWNGLNNFLQPWMKY